MQLRPICQRTGQWIVALKRATSERLHVTPLGEPQQEGDDHRRGSEGPDHLEGRELPLKPVVITRNATL